MDQLHEMLLSVKEHYPDMNLIVPHGGRIIPRMIQDRLGNNIGVLVDKDKDSSVVENFYKSEYFYNLCLQMREWHQQGLFLDKAYMGKEDRQSYLAQGDSFGSFLNLSEISIFNIARYVEYPMAAVQLAPRIADSDSCNMIWCISRDSKNPELAMKVLNLMYTDVEISRLLAYGQEGIDYEFAAAGYVKPAENSDYIPAGQWTSKVWSWPVGVEIEQWQEEEELLDYVVFWEEPVKDSPALGFLFDVSEVRVEVDACQNIIDKYENALLCGELWPKNGIESFNHELEMAGIDRVIAEKQRQLDAFMEKYR
ncbi:ABC transporter substrate-binding protein [Lacrimispora sp.]|uniref:ABC transporter substrate-binding protein n=1 Tax=Lacrimispora sp. TaxID=2719234 RepID=UPI0032E44F2C